MNILKVTLTTSIAIASLAFTSCETNRQLMGDSPSTSKRQHPKPQFIEDIAIAPSSVTITVPAPAVAKTQSFAASFVTNLQKKYAAMMDVLPQNISNYALYNFIDEWYGVRYRLGGNDKKGIDCSAFVQQLYNNVFCTSLVRTACQQFNLCSMIWSKDSLSEGDLVFFHTRGSRISHVGIYLANNHFVHASSSKGVMISSLDDTYWRKAYAGAGQMPRS